MNYILYAALIIIVLICIIIFLIVRYLVPFYRLKSAINRYFNDKGVFDIDNKIWENPFTFTEVLDSVKEQDENDTIKKLKNKHAEYLALQNQINPHFLYNTLEAIRGDALSEGCISIAEITKALAVYFRYTITDIGDLVTLEEELDNIENYFKIQKYRFGEKIKMEVYLPEERNMVLKTRLPKLTMQPIVENAIVHGLECKMGEGRVSINIEYTKDRLQIRIKDDGTGIDEENVIYLNEMFYEQDKRPLELGEGGRGNIALTNVNSRLKLLFGEEFGLHIFSIKDMGTEVVINMPITYKDLEL